MNVANNQSGVGGGNSGKKIVDNRPITGKGQYDMTNFELSNAGEQTIMGDTINTMDYSQTKGVSGV
jgi:hypothetical protein